jgi:hypothetical protein
MIKGGRSVEGNRSKSGRTPKNILVAGEKSEKKSSKPAAKARSKSKSKARSKRG